MVKAFFITLWLVLLSSNQFSFCQTSPYPVETWVKQLQPDNDLNQKKLGAIEATLVKVDSAAAFSVFSQLKNAGPASNHYFNARLLHLTAWYYLHNNLPSGRLYFPDLYSQALNEAYLTANADFIAFISWAYGSAMENIQELELAATYLLNAAEMNKNLVFQSGDYDSGVAGNLQYLSELLFHAKLYEQSMYYTRRFIEQYKPPGGSPDYPVLKAWNTLGQGYEKTGKLDSALLCYQRSGNIAANIKHKVWQGINAGFIGQVYFLQKQYDKAKPLLQYDYNINKDTDVNIAGYSLQWLGRIDLATGRLDSGLWKLKKAVQILHRPAAYTIQNREYREAAYYALADAFRLQGTSDSFYHYFQLYLSLHDSLQKVTVRSSWDLAKMRFENGKNFYAVQLLQQQKRAEELSRNFIIAAIVALSVIAILVLVKQRQQSEYRHQLALQQKEAAEAETAAAKSQLALFTQNIIEKTTLIEKLQHQLQDRKANVVQQQLLDELSGQTILTEEEWLQFKQLFEKVHAGFFARLKEKTPDMTAAEQRMAGLTRLQFTNHQIASILGISTDTVRKTRLRLRNRLRLPADANLDEVLAAV